MIWALFLATEERLALVLEDDMEFRPDFAEILDNVDVLPDGLDTLRLSNPETGIRIPAGTVANGMEIVKYSDIPVTSGAYIESRRGARKIVDNGETRFLPYDRTICEDAYLHGLASFGILPAPVRQCEMQSSMEAAGQRPKTRRTKRLRRSVARPGSIRSPFRRARRLTWRIRGLSLAVWLRCKLRKREIGRRRHSGRPVPESVKRVEYRGGLTPRKMQLSKNV